MRLPELPIEGAHLSRHQVQPDHRGNLSVITSRAHMAQWNLVQSKAGTLRGMHGHLSYDELYVPVTGRMFIALKDARESSPTFENEFSFWSDEHPHTSLFVPVGIAHAVLFETDGALLYGLSQEWTGDQEFACRFDGPDISIPWPDPDPALSEKDGAAGTFRQMVAAMREAG